MEHNNQLLMYRDCTPVVDVDYDSERNHSLAWVIAEAISDAAGIPPTELPPLYDAIDLDAVAQLLDSQDGTSSETAVLGFTFEQWNVFVRSDGSIRVCNGTHSQDPVPVFD